MPLTARHTDGRHVDSTDDRHWAEVHISGYKGLFCPECRHAMHARSGGDRRVRHFAHNADSPDCSLTKGESEEHRHVKVLIALAIRELTGWTAEIEYPGDGWRADVLAISPSGDRQIAFEPQFSYIHESTARKRTERHAASGVETVWLPKELNPSTEGLPRIRLTYDAQERTARVPVRVIGPAARRGGTAPPLWSLRWTPVGQFARQVCTGVLAYDADDGFFATNGDRAEMARLTQAAEVARKDRQVQLEQLHAARQAQLERKRAEHQARINAQSERIDREIAAHRDERARQHQREQQEVQSAQGEAAPWTPTGAMSDEELLALTERYVAEPMPFPGWIAAGERLHGALARRGLLHD